MLTAQTGCTGFSNMFLVNSSTDVPPSLIKYTILHFFGRGDFF